MSIDVSGWPESKAFQLRIARAGMKAFANDRERFLNGLIWPEDALDDAENEGRDVAARVSRALVTLAHEWKSEYIAIFQYSFDLVSYRLLYNADVRLFLVIEKGEDATYVCGGDIWQVRSDERWRSLVRNFVTHRITTIQAALPEKISIYGLDMITPFDLALAFSKHCSPPKEKAFRFLESFEKILEPKETSGTRRR